MPEQIAGDGVFGIAPSHGADRVGRFIRPLSDYLAARLGEAVRISILRSFVDVAGGIGAGKLTFGWLAPLVYAQSADKLQLLLRSVRGDAGSYCGALFTREESGIRSVADLAGKNVAWVTRDSVSGFILPAQLLRERGIKLAGEQFLGTHAAVVRMVAQGAADAGATFCSLDANRRPVHAGWEETVDVGTTRFRPLEIYGPIPSDVLCAAPGLVGPWREGFAAAMAAIHETQQGKDIAMGLFGADRFVPAQAGEYEQLRRAVALG